MSARRIFAQPARYAAIAPYVWMVLFFLVPFGFVLKISLSQTAIAQPPYLPVFDLTQGLAAIKAAFAQLSLDNFSLLVSDNLYISSYLRSLVVAVTSTLILLLIGYPIAYGMARLPQRWQAIAMMLVIIPFWTSFLIRIYAWINILQHDGLLNKVLLALHLDPEVDVEQIRVRRHEQLPQVRTEPEELEELLGKHVALSDRQSMWGSARSCHLRVAASAGDHVAMPAKESLSAPCA